MNNTNKELEINPTVLLDQAKMIERMVDIDDYKEAEDIFFQMLDSYREQGVQESTDTIATALGACKMGITKNKTTEEVLTELLKALTTQEDQLIVKDHE